MGVEFEKVCAILIKISPLRGQKMSSKEKENVRVTISDNFPIDKAIKKFKRLCDSYGIVKIYRDREAYKKPCEKNKEKRENSEKRRKKTVSRGGRFRQKI